MSRNPTFKQMQTLFAIKFFHPVTYMELAEYFGITHKAAWDRVMALLSKGFVDTRGFTARGILITGNGHDIIKGYGMMIETKELYKRIRFK